MSVKVRKRSGQRGISNRFRKNSKLSNILTKTELNGVPSISAKTLVFPSWLSRQVSKLSPLPSQKSKNWVFFSLRTRRKKFSAADISEYGRSLDTWSELDTEVPRRYEKCIKWSKIARFWSSLIREPNKIFLVNNQDSVGGILKPLFKPMQKWSHLQTYVEVYTPKNAFWKARL